MTDTLGPWAVLMGMADALPAHQPGDDSSDLASSYEAIALLVHAYLAALGFRLCGFDLDKPLSDRASLSPRLPPRWNAGFGSLTFVYKHKQSSMEFVIRIDRMGTKVEVRGLAVGDEKIYRFERAVRDVVDAKALPIRITMREGQEDRSDLPSKLRSAFVSENAISDILNDLRIKIVQKLIPKLQREGYIETAEAEEEATSERRAQEAQNPQRPFPAPSRPAIYSPAGPLPEMARPRPRAPVGDFPPPGFEDEYEINRPPRNGPVVMPGGRHPFNIGHDDLNPPGLGPHDPLRGSFVPGGLPHPGAPGGMHPTFDSPLFTGQGFTGQGGYPNQGFYDPQAPPGARWDPIGPGGMPRYPGPGQGPGGNGFGGGFGGGPFI